jgi:hypothetical protein
LKSTTSSGCACISSWFFFFFFFSSDLFSFPTSEIPGKLGSFLGSDLGLGRLYFGSRKGDDFVEVVAVSGKASVDLNAFGKLDQAVLDLNVICDKLP